MERVFEHPASIWGTHVCIAMIALHCHLLVHSHCQSLACTVGYTSMSCTGAVAVLDTGCPIVAHVADLAQQSWTHNLSVALFLVLSEAFPLLHI